MSHIFIKAAPALSYLAWSEFYANRITEWMPLDSLRVECGRLQDAGNTPSPELLLVHAMHALELAKEQTDGQNGIAGAGRLE